MFCFGCHTHENSKSTLKPQICHEGMPVRLSGLERFTQTTRRVTGGSQSGAAIHPTNKSKYRMHVKRFFILLFFSMNRPSVSHDSKLYPIFFFFFLDLISTILITLDMSHSRRCYDKENNDIVTHGADIW